MAKKQIDLVGTRNGLGLNQSEFWSRIGVTQSGGSRYETGRKMPKPVAMLFELVYGIKNDEGAALVLQDMRTRAKAQQIRTELGL